MSATLGEITSADSETLAERDAARRRAASGLRTEVRGRFIYEEDPASGVMIARYERPSLRTRTAIFLWQRMIWFKRVGRAIRTSAIMVIVLGPVGEDA